MKTLTITEARRDLGKLCLMAAEGEQIAIISGNRVIQLKPVEVVAWEDTYASREYGLTLQEAEAFEERAARETAAKEKRGAYARFSGKFDPDALG